MTSAANRPRRVIDMLRSRYPELGPWAYEGGVWRGDGVTFCRVSHCSQSVGGSEVYTSRAYLYFDDPNRPTQHVPGFGGRTWTE